MKVEICYNVLKTAKVEVDDSYREMIYDEDEWDKLIRPLSETVVEKIREIEGDASLYEDSILGVFDAETGEVIYEN
jgi:hypothetical protein